MKKFGLGYLALLTIFAALTLTGCGSNGGTTSNGTGTDITDTNDGGNANGTDNAAEDTSGNNSKDNGDDDNLTNDKNDVTDNNMENSSANNEENGAAGLDNTADSADDNMGGTANDGVLNDQDTLDGANIDGGTITNRAGSLFDGNDGIGMRGSENITGNKMLY